MNIPNLFQLFTSCVPGDTDLESLNTCYLGAQKGLKFKNMETQ